MNIDRWYGPYKVRIFPWIDGKRIYVNVQYFAPGQSVERPPVWDRTVYITDDPAGRKMIEEFTDTLIQYIAKLNISQDVDLIITVEPDSAQKGDNSGLKATGKLLNLKNARKRYGSVTLNGLEITLLRDAYVSDDGEYYLAEGTDGTVDEFGYYNLYRVAFETTPRWKEATARYDELFRKDQEILTDNEYNELSGLSSFLSDESNACDWDKPAEIVSIQNDNPFWMCPKAED